MRHLPRASFTQRQHRIIHWGMAACGLTKVPSPYIVKTAQEILQSSCGIKTNRYMGAFGHPYYVNDLASIIAQVCSLSLAFNSSNTNRLHIRIGPTLWSDLTSTHVLRIPDSDFPMHFRRSDGSTNSTVILQIKWFASETMTSIYSNRHFFTAVCVSCQYCGLIVKISHSRECGQ